MNNPETIFAEIAYLMVELSAPEGTQIVQEREVSNCMYIIFDGSVKVHKQNQLLAKPGEKNFFGELSLLDTETRSATVTTLTDCILFRIDQELFYDLMESRPEVVRGVIKILCQRLRAVNEKLLELQSNHTHS